MEVYRYMRRGKKGNPFWYLCLSPSQSIKRRLFRKKTFCRKEMDRFAQVERERCEMGDAR